MFSYTSQTAFKMWLSLPEGCKTLDVPWSGHRMQTDNFSVKVGKSQKQQHATEVHLECASSATHNFSMNKSNAMFFTIVVVFL